MRTLTPESNRKPFREEGSFSSLTSQVKKFFLSQKKILMSTNMFKNIILLFASCARSYETVCVGNFKLRIRKVISNCVDTNLYFVLKICMF